VAYPEEKVQNCVDFNKLSRKYISFYDKKQEPKVNYALILAGGSGTRLWPLSRNNRSKQALTLVGTRSMFQHATDRLNPFFSTENIFVVTREDQSNQLSSQVPSIPIPNYILEPLGRGTAPAIGLAAIHLSRKDQDAVMAVLTADHFISDTEQFHHVLEAAFLLAGQGHLVTLGIKPESPSTGFGYIQQGESLKPVFNFDVYRVDRFIEKPDLKTAKNMLADGGYSWNSGMFVWRVDRIIKEFEKQMPDFYAQLMEVDAAIDTPHYQEVIGKVWQNVDKQTIDYGVMENASDVVVIPVDIGWTDIGSWASMSDIYQPNSEGNIVKGPFVGIDSYNSIFFGEERLVATIGIQDLVIVDTKDALLICTKGREQEVREIVELLKKNHLQKWL
jgi:mannose-1-phosphate guanylyltransferase